MMSGTEWAGAEMLPLKSSRPRCFHRGPLPTGNPQSGTSVEILGAAGLLFKAGRNPIAV